MSQATRFERLITPLNPDNGWSILGPGGGGAMYIPTIQPGNPERVLVACDMTGAYLTGDGGQHWREVNFKGWAKSFAFSPADPNTVYAGATGLYRSRDAGENWQLIFPAPDAVTGEKFSGDHGTHSFQANDAWPGGQVQVIFISPHNPAHLLIGVQAERLYLYESRDEGASWIPWADVPGKDFKKITALPLAPGGADGLLLVDAQLYTFRLADRSLTPLHPAGGAPVLDFSYTCVSPSGVTAIFAAAPGRWQDGCFHSGMHRSLDAGDTWEELCTGLDADLPPGEERLINRVAACPSDAGILYCSAVERDDFPLPSPSFGIFTSTDLGQTWQWALKVSPGQPINRVTGWVENEFRPAWGGAPFYLQAAPDNPNICYATDWATTYHTVDSGRTWQQVYCRLQPDGSAASRGLDVININSISFDPHTPGHIALACTDVGAFQSFNAGQSWSYCARGVAPTWEGNCYQLVFDPTIPGKAWGVWSGCHDIPRQKMFRPGNLHTFEGGVCLSTDHLASWQPSSRGLPEKLIPTSIVLDERSPENQRVLYIAAVGKGVYRSDDDGASWTLKSHGLGAAPNAWQIVLLPDGELILLVCRGWKDGQIVPGGVYHSVDGAETWQALPLPPGVNAPNDCCYDPHHPQTLYLAAWPDTSDSVPQGGGLWVSHDRGVSWQCCFPARHFVYGVCCDPHRPGGVYLTTFEGAVHCSSNGGQSWRQMAGFDFKYAKQPFIDPRDEDHIYVATFGSSVWKGNQCFYRST